jgi:phosphoglycerate kinase
MMLTIEAGVGPFAETLPTNVLPSDWRSPILSQRRRFLDNPFMAKLSIRDLQLEHKHVFIRVDFNVPLSEDGSQIMDDTRIRATLPTLEYALRNRAKVILASHLGRPKGKPNPTMSLRPVVDRLRQLLDHHLGEAVNVGFSPDCVGETAEETARQLESGQVLLLENLRFHAAEEKNDPAFARQLARLCEIYVNDAFGSAHRAHASTEGITHFVPQSAAGLLMEKELNYLGKALTEPDRPFVAILGGAKVSDKIEVIDNLLEKVDALLIGGGMAYTFLNANGQKTGKSLLEADKLDVAREATRKAKDRGVQFLLPVDHVLADRFAPDAKTQLFSGDADFPADWMGLDIGPKTVDLFVDRIAQARTIIWNGPMGVFEMPAFARGTIQIAEAVADNQLATSIVGGGDSVAAVEQAGVADRITHISTGGGASLEFLEGKKLPGVEALTEKTA